MYSHGIEMACQKQKEFVKSSVACKWNLAEAQQKLGSLALHNSESLDQEHAKAQTAISELRQREEEWRQKEEALVQRERMCLWNMDAISKDVFNKVLSFIGPADIRKDWNVCANQLCISVRKQQNPVNSIQFDSLGEVITETCIPSSV